ncbi:MAG: STAS domain-containing protein [Alphaproteobacteria bacterium]
MNIETEALGAAVILKPLGRIDQNTAPAFQVSLLAALDGGTGAAVALDMSGVDFLSSIGLRALMIAHKRCQANGARLVLFALTPIVREVFSISRFDSVLRCFDARDPALAYLSA